MTYLIEYFEQIANDYREVLMNVESFKGLSYEEQEKIITAAVMALE